MSKTKSTLIWLLILHISLFIYALGSFLSKLASGEQFLSLPFLLLYAGMLLLIGIYALLWQQVIKHIPLITAYANKAITILWGIFWGIIAFKEGLSIVQIISVIIIVVGILLVVLADGVKKND